MVKIKIKPVKIRISTRRVGNRTAVTTTVNGRTTTKYVK